MCGDAEAVLSSAEFLHGSVTSSLKAFGGGLIVFVSR